MQTASTLHAQAGNLMVTGWVPIRFLHWDPPCRRMPYFAIPLYPRVTSERKPRDKGVICSHPAPQGHMLLWSPIPSLQHPPKQFLGQTVIGSAVNSSQKLSPSQPQQQLAG